MPTPQTVAIQVVGPYRGTRIAGTSDDVDAVRLSRFYQFDDYGVRITDIPAKRDNSTGRLYVSAAIAKRVHAKVREIEGAMGRIRVNAQGASLPVRLNLSISASEFLPDAA